MEEGEEGVKKGCLVCVRCLEVRGVKIYTFGGGGRGSGVGRTLTVND